MGTAVATAVIQLSEDLDKDHETLPTRLPATDTDNQTRNTQEPLIVALKEDPT